MACRTYKIFNRRWRAHRGIFFIRIPEVLFTVGMLVLTTRSAPDVWRTTFWQIGYNNGLNSSPNIILYAAANNQKAKVPFVWSQTLTDFNSALSIVSLFVWLASLVATIMHIFLPIIGLFVSFSMSAVYVASIVGQAGPDHADPAHPSPSPWYLRKGCGLAAANGVAGECHKAQAQFAFTILLLATYLFQLALAIWSMFPNPANDRTEEEQDEFEIQQARRAREKAGELQPMTPFTPGPFTPGVPFTPRTEAYKTLDRKLPLRTS